MTSLKRRRFKIGRSLCAYCGTAVSTDREDPIPISLYPLSVRPDIQFLKIPACRQCNDAKSRVDNSLRDYLMLSHDSGRHHLAQELFDDTGVRAVEENHVRMLDRYYSGLPALLPTRNGPIIELGFSVPFDVQPVEEAVMWLTRGMHWAVFGTPADSAGTTVRLIQPREASRRAKEFGQKGVTGHFQQGEVYTCGWIVAPTGTTYWAHAFFDGVLFLARTREAIQPS